MSTNAIVKDLRSPTGKYRKRIVQSKKAYRRKGKHKENSE